MLHGHSTAEVLSEFLQVPVFSFLTSCMIYDTKEPMKVHIKVVFQAVKVVDQEPLKRISTLKLPVRFLPTFYSFDWTPVIPSSNRIERRSRNQLTHLIECFQVWIVIAALQTGPVFPPPKTMNSSRFQCPRKRLTRRQSQSIPTTLSYSVNAQ